MFQGPSEVPRPDGVETVPETAIEVAPGTPPEAPVPVADAWDRLTRSPLLLDAILPTILLRGMILVFAVLAVVIMKPDALPHGSLLGIWDRWDAPHFFEVARYGYGPPADPARIVIFPLTPALFAIGALVFEPLVAGMLISFGATLAAAAGLYRLMRLDHGRTTSRLAVLAMSVFPTAFSLVAPYSEAIFLAFVIWAFLFARTGRWSAAGVCAMFAGLARLQGAFILPALAVEYLLTRRRIDRDAGWLLLGAVGPLAYLAINYVTFGNPLYFLGIQKSVFHVATTTPWAALASAWNGALAVQPTEFWATVYLAPMAAYIVLGLATLWAAFGKGGRPSYAVYAGLSFLSFATLTWPISLPRYIMGVFPIFMAGGRLGRLPWLGPPLFVASTLLFGICLTLFVIGHWAF